VLTYRFIAERSQFGTWIGPGLGIVDRKYPVTYFQNERSHSGVALGMQSGWFIG